MRRFQRALVCGLGASGVAAARLLRAEGAEVCAVDERETAENLASAAALAALGCAVVLGARTPPAGDFDVAVASPGLPAAGPFLTAVAQRGMVPGELGERRDRRVQRMRVVEVPDRGRVVGLDVTLKY